MKCLCQQLILFVFLACNAFATDSKDTQDFRNLVLRGRSKDHKCPKRCPGFWQPLRNQPTFLNGATAQLLLTDGSVLVNDVFNTFTAAPFVASGNIWKLTPDLCGSYVNGTWSQIASLPDGYKPLFYASAVLPDGRVIFEGGEYNYPLEFAVWTSLGAIYDPFSNTWALVNPPPFFTNTFGPPPKLPIGDAASVVLADGTFMLANALSGQAALLDSKTLTWTPTGAGKLATNNEEGWTLLPDGTVLTVDCYVGVTPYPSDPTNSKYTIPKQEHGKVRVAPSIPSQILSILRWDLQFFVPTAQSLPSVTMGTRVYLTRAQNSGQLVPIFLPDQGIRVNWEC